MIEDSELVQDYKIYECRFCHSKDNLKKCSKCKSVWYCSKEHQSEDWTRHKISECKKLSKNREMRKIFALSGMNEKDFETLSQRAIVSSDPVLKFMLASYYFDGHGVKINIPEALKLFREAAKLGNIDAQKQLADCYLEGDEVPINKSEAVRWFRRVFYTIIKMS